VTHLYRMPAPHTWSHPVTLIGAGIAVALVLLLSAQLVLEESGGPAAFPASGRALRTVLLVAFAVTAALRLVLVVAGSY
jgi:hypothetical protein